MREGLGSFGIGHRIFVVGAIPVLVAAGIALGAWILLVEAERARIGAVIATETVQTLTALGRARAEAVNGAAGTRAVAERQFDGLAATASGQLARGNAKRNPQRTASTAAALMIGLALVTLVAVLGQGIRSTFTDAVDRIFTSDYAITAQNNFSPIPIDCRR